MKRLFLKQISFVLALVLLLSLTGVAEDGGVDVAIESHDVDEIVLPSIEVFPEEAEGLELSIESPLIDGGEVFSTEAPTSEDSGDDNAVIENGLPKKLTLGVKETYTLSVKKATFKSSKTSVATVSKKGVITAKKKGTAKITVMSGKKKVGTCTVTVVAAPKKVSLGMKEAAMGLKETLTLVPVITDKSHTIFTYTTKNKKIATVSTKGVITAKKVGSTTITVKTHNGKTASLKVTVKKAPTKVTVKPKTLTLEVGQTANLTASVPNKTASFMLTWTSGNKKIATVDENGIVTAVKAGKTKITVKTFNKKKAVCTVKVTKPVPTVEPTEEPTEAPTEAPTEVPTEGPTVAPTEAPTAAPTEGPTVAPTEGPTEAPTDAPTAAPTEPPTEAPTAAPTATPTAEPTATSTAEPTATPTAEPTAIPTAEPTATPTAEPTATPTAEPTVKPALKSAGAEQDSFDLYPTDQATLRVVTECDGTPGLTYKWYQGENEITDANGSSYAITAGNVGTTTYRCDVSYDGDPIPVLFTVVVDNDLTAKAKSATAKTVYTGNTAILEVNARCAKGDPTFQWYKGSETIAGATAATFTTEAITERTTYKCMVGDAYDSDEIPVNFTVMVKDPSLISATAVKARVELKPTEQEMLQVNTECDGAPQLTYTWYEGENTEPAAVTNEPEYEVSAGTVGTTSYKCVVSDGQKSRTVNFTVVVDNNLTATVLSPNEQTVFIGDTATLKVVGDCEMGDPVYQWYKGDEPIPSATAASYTTETITEDTAYKCEVGDAYGSKTIPLSFTVNAKAPSLTSASAETASFNLKPTEQETLLVNTVCDGAPGLTYFWYEGESTEPVATTTEPDYAITAGNIGSYTYKCLVSDGTNSELVLFTVNVSNGFSAAALDNRSHIAILTGNGATLEVAARCDNGDIAYAWYRGEETEPVGENAQYETGVFAEAGEYTYTCEVSDAYGSKDSVAFTVSVSETDILTAASAKEAAVTIAPGQAAVLKVNTVCAGSPALTYKWICGGNTLQEGSQDSYTTEAAATVGVTDYVCEVSDGKKTFPVNFTVTVDNHLTAAAKDGLAALAIYTGESATLEVDAACTEGQPTYQWYCDGEQLEGKTDAQCATEAFTEIGSHTFKCVVGDAYGSETVEVDFAVAVSVKPVLTGASAEEASVTIAPKQTATLKAVPVYVGEPSLTYTWTSGDSILQQGTQDSYTTAEATSVGDTTYICQVSDGTNTLPVEFTVNVDNRLTASAVGGAKEIVTIGQETTLAVEANALCEEGGFTYKWYRSGSNVAVGTGASYTTGAITADDVYICDVSDAFGSAGVSVRFTITAVEPPVNPLDNPYVARIAEVLGLDAEGLETLTRKTAKELYELDEDDASGLRFYTDKIVWVLNENRNGVIIAGCEESQKKIVINDTYQGLPVIGIKNYAFEDDTVLEEIVVPETVNSIGYEAFAHCSKLAKFNAVDGGEDFVLPAGLTELSSSVFMNDPCIRKVIIPSGVTTIEWGSFYECTGLEDVFIPGTVEVIGEEAFVDCTSLAALTISEGVKEIEWRAFGNCASLTALELPASLTYISNSAFRNCENLSISAPMNSYAYGWALENGFMSLDDELAVVPRLYDGDVTTADNGIDLIWDHLSGKEATLTIYIQAENAGTLAVSGDWLTLESGNVFEAGKHTVEISVSKNLTGAVREGAVTIATTNLTRIVAVKQLPYLIADLTQPSVLVGKMTLSGTIEGSVTLPCEDMSFTWNTATGATEYAVGLITPNRAMYGSDGTEPFATFAAATVGSSFSAHISQAMLEPGCEKAHRMFLWLYDEWGHRYSNYYDFFVRDEANADWRYYYQRNDGAITAAVVTGYKGSETVVTIPSSFNGYPVVAIEEEAFFENTAITEIVIPNGVSEIGYEAFMSCTALQCITVPDSVEAIRNHAFDGCNALTTINVNEGTYAYRWFQEHGFFDGEAILESAHPYADNSDEEWTYSYPSAVSALRVTFSTATELEEDYDTLTIIDSEGGETVYTGKELSGRSVVVAGNSFTIRLQSDGSVTYFGFRITNIEPAAGLIGAEADGSTELEIVSGQPATLKVNATVSVECDLSWQWYENGTLIETDAEDTFTIDSVKFEGEYRCVVSDEWGNTAEVTFNVIISVGEPVEINEANFPDATFREYVERFDTNEDGWLSGREREKVKSISVGNKEITSLKGVEWFTALTQLYCYRNQLTTLDISKNTALVVLSCSVNKLTSLDLSQNASLEKLSCGDNQLTELDAGSNAALTYLYCTDNQLRLLQINGCALLEELHCSYNLLEDLDISGNTELRQLYCTSNQLETLNVSNNVKLTHIYCEANQLHSLNVSNNTELEQLYCGNNQMSALDVGQNRQLLELLCYNNHLSELIIGSNPALRRLECSGNQISQLGINNNPQLLSYITNGFVFETDIWFQYSDGEASSESRMIIDKATKLIIVPIPTGTVPSLALGEPTQATITTAGDRACFSFIPASSEKYTFKATDADAKLFLLDSDWNFLGYVTGSNATLRRELTAGTQYYFAAGYASDTTVGAFDVCLDEASGLITAEPDGETSIRVNKGVSVNLKVNATFKGNGEQNYQWARMDAETITNGNDGYVDMTGETGATLTIASATQTTQYRCHVSDETGYSMDVEFAVNVVGEIALGETVSAFVPKGTTVFL